MTSNSYSPPGLMGLLALRVAMANCYPSQSEPPDLQNLNRTSDQHEDTQLQQDSGQTHMKNRQLQHDSGQSRQNVYVQNLQLNQDSGQTCQNLQLQNRNRQDKQLKQNSQQTHQNRQLQQDSGQTRQNLQLQQDSGNTHCQNLQLQQDSGQRRCQNQQSSQDHQCSSQQQNLSHTNKLESSQTQIQQVEKRRQSLSVLEAIQKCYLDELTKTLEQSFGFLLKSVQDGRQTDQLQQRCQDGNPKTRNIQTQAQMIKQEQAVMTKEQDNQQHSQPTGPTQSQVSRQYGVPVHGNVQSRISAITRNLQTSTTESVTDVSNPSLPGTSLTSHRMAVLAY